MQDSNIATNSGPGNVDAKRLKEMADTWGKLTTQYLQKQLAFVLDSKVVSAPRVESGGQAGRV